MTPAARERLRVRLPLFAVSGAAWLLLIAQPHAMHGSSVSARMSASALMFAAMMAPLLGPPLRHVRDRSFARRRLRAMLLFAGGYSLLWIVAGVALLIAAAWIRATDSTVFFAAVLAMAVWQFSPAKQRCLNRCHAHSALAAFGGAADRDVLLFGLKHGLWCIGACSALMLLPMLFARGHLVAMALVTLWLAGERLEKPMTPRWRLRGPAKTIRLFAGQMRLMAG
jgi:predicted metal-binding membrane protein